MTDTVGSQSALPLAGAPARRFLAPWGYPPTRAPLLTLRTAADAGDLSAQFTLGWIYEHGADVPQDYREAIDWYRRAASHGEPEAINTVGLLYYYGKGVPKDPREATIWFHQAAELGHPEAQWNLAGMYYRGDGAPHDDTQAVLWCRRAAEQDCPPAQHSLANIYHDGRDVVSACRGPGLCQSAMELGRDVLRRPRRRAELRHRRRVVSPGRGPGPRAGASPP